MLWYRMERKKVKYYLETNSHPGCVLGENVTCKNGRLFKKLSNTPPPKFMADYSSNNPVPYAPTICILR